MEIQGLEAQQRYVNQIKMLAHERSRTLLLIAWPRPHYLRVMFIKTNARSLESDIIGL